MIGRDSARYVLGVLAIVMELLKAIQKILHNYIGVIQRRDNYTA